MSRLFRTLCVSFCAALMAVTSLYGASQTGHRIAHASDWPPIASPGSGFDADHDPSRPNHDGDGPEYPPKQLRTVV